MLRYVFGLQLKIYLRSRGLMIYPRICLKMDLKIISSTGSLVIRKQDVFLFKSYFIVEKFPIVKSSSEEKCLNN